VLAARQEVLSSSEVGPVPQLLRPAVQISRLPIMGGISFDFKFRTSAFSNGEPLGPSQIARSSIRMKLVNLRQLSVGLLPN
jgi:hypothetical protein